MAPRGSLIGVSPKEGAAMIQMSHIVVLSQPEFVEREICSVLAAPHRAGRLGRWLSFARRAAAA
jgi:hypothetical protein